MTSRKKHLYLVSDLLKEKPRFVLKTRTSQFGQFSLLWSLLGLYSNPKSELSESSVRPSCWLSFHPPDGNFELSRTFDSFGHFRKTPIRAAFRF